MEEKNHLSQDEINKLQEIATLQQYLFNLTEENYISTISFFNRSQYILDSTCHETFLRNLFWTFQLRPKSISKLFDLLIWFLTNEDITAHTIFIETILSFYNRCVLNFESHSKFVYLFFNGIFKILDNSFDTQLINTEYITQFIEKLIKPNQEEIENIKKEISFQKDDNLLSIIYHDDISKFTQISSIPEFDINSKISIESPFLFAINKNMTLIEVAASLGSVQIFKYIVINEGILNNQHHFSKYSIQGGCTEIIRIIEQKGFSFKEAEIGEASYYHQLAILQWILDSKGISNITEALKKCCLSNFAEEILFFENNSDNYSKSFYQCQNLIEWSASSGSYDILNFLLSNKNIFQLNNSIFSVVEYGELGSAELLKDDFHSCVNKSNRIHLRPIHIATQKGDIFMVNFLINNFPEIELNAQDRYGATVLHLSIRYNHPELFKLFLSIQKVDINLCDYGDTSPLHEAVMSENGFYVKALLEDERTNVNIIDQSGKTPFIQSIDSKSIEYVELFLNSQKKIEKFGDAVFESITKEGGCEIGSLLIHSPRYDINDSDNFERIIGRIIENKKFEYVQYFIEQDRFDINMRFGRELKTILHLCCSMKDMFRFIPLILKRKDVDINAHDSNGLTPLHEAMRSQNNDFSICLIKDPRVDVNARDNGNQTPLHYAASNWSIVPLTDLLMSPKINVNLIDKDGKTALFIACELGVVDNVEVLLNDYNVDTEIEIESVFKYICIYKWCFYFEFFFSYYTAIQMAGRKGHIEVVNVYRKYQNTILKSKQQQESKCYIY